MSSNTHDKIDTFFNSLPEPNKAICTALRKVILDNMPGTIEIIAHGVPGYTITGKSSDRIVYIAPQNGWVNLGFFFGADIPDPEGLITGEGKRMRHIKITDKKQAASPAIKEIIKQAWAKAPGDIASLKAKK